MEIVKEQSGGETIYNISGRIDANTSRELEDTLAAHIKNDKEPICINFADVSYISSAGLRVLVLSKKRADAANIDIRLTGVANQIRDIFKMTGFLGVLRIDG